MTCFSISAFILIFPFPFCGQHNTAPLYLYSYLSTISKGATAKTQEKFIAAFNNLIVQKGNEVEGLRIALQRNKDSLLKWVEEHEYEI